MGSPLAVLLRLARCEDLRQAQTPFGARGMCGYAAHNFEQ